MGCDIHFYVETFQNGQWNSADVWEENDDKEGMCKRIIPPQHSFFDERNYAVFSKLGNVRNYNEIPPISETRGIPVDACQEIKTARTEWDTDGHSESWLTFEELKKSDWKDPAFDDFVPCLRRLWKLKFHKNLGENEIRVVFWFDN